MLALIVDVTALPVALSKPLPVIVKNSPDVLMNPPFAIAWLPGNRVPGTLIVPVGQGTASDTLPALDWMSPTVSVLPACCGLILMLVPCANTLPTN